MKNQELQEQLNRIRNGWEIKELIGEGSYGKVYRIERDEFGHVYQSALKVITIPKSLSELKSVINDGMGEAGAREYFYSIVKEIVEEFTLMSRLKGNSNIVSYEDHAVVQTPEGIGWNIYIRMELLTPLMDYYRKTTVSIGDIVKLGIDVCSALEICSQYNIIHRDVKPENIFISEMGNYKLGDFGIAKQLEKPYGSLSRKGTMNYMAPEVYKGEKYDQTVDIYSLGLVLYRFLNNNRMPFVPPYPQPILYVDKEEANIKRMKGMKLEPPCNAHDKLAEVVLKACAFDEADRYSSPTEMKRELISILNEDIGLNSEYPNDVGVEKIDVDYYAHKNRMPEQTETLTYSESAKLDDSRRIWLPVLISCIGLILMGTVIWFVYDNSRKSTTPYIVDMTLDEAKQLTSQDEYRLIVEASGEEYSDSIEKGHIISQDIDSGTIIYKGTVIHAVVSKGKELIQVPDVTGLNVDEAIKLLTDNDLTYEMSEEYSDEVEADAIISQSVKAESKVEKHTNINLVKSLGKKPEVKTTAPASTKKSSKSSGDVKWEDVK